MINKKSNNKLRKVFKFKFQGKNYTIKDYRICSNLFSQVRGLMFRKKSKPLLFVLNKPKKMAIHSYFVCFDFIAVWMLNNKIIDIKLVRPWERYIIPDEKFNYLLEVPVLN